MLKFLKNLKARWLLWRASGLLFKEKEVKLSQKATRLSRFGMNLEIRDISTEYLKERNRLLKLTDKLADWIATEEGFESI